MFWGQTHKMNDRLTPDYRSDRGMPMHATDFGAGIHGFLAGGLTHVTKGRAQPRNCKFLISVDALCRSPQYLGSDGATDVFDGEAVQALKQALLNTVAGEKKVICGSDFASLMNPNNVSAIIASQVSQLGALKLEFSDALYIPTIPYGKRLNMIGPRQARNDPNAPGNPWMQQGVLSGDGTSYLRPDGTQAILEGGFANQPYDIPQFPDHATWSQAISDFVSTGAAPVMPWVLISWDADGWCLDELQPYQGSLTSFNYYISYFDTRAMAAGGFEDSESYTLLWTFSWRANHQTHLSDHYHGPDVNQDGASTGTYEMHPYFKFRRPETGEVMGTPFWHVNFISSPQTTAALDFTYGMHYSDDTNNPVFYCVNGTRQTHPDSPNLLQGAVVGDYDELIGSINVLPEPTILFSIYQAGNGQTANPADGRSKLFGSALDRDHTAYVRYGFNLNTGTADGFNHYVYIAEDRNLTTWSKKAFSGTYGTGGGRLDTFIGSNVDRNFDALGQFQWTSLIGMVCSAGEINVVGDIAVRKL